MSEDSQTEDLLSQESHSPDAIWFWHPLSLKFYDDHYEHLFGTLLSDSLVRSERLVHLLGSVPGIVITIATWATMSWTAVIMELGWSFLLAPFFYSLATWRPLVYRAWRLPIAVFIRCGHICTMITMVPAEGMPPTTPQGVMARLLAKSPVANMVFCAFNLSMPFHHHMLTSLVQLLISMVWVRDFCTLCRADMASMSAFSKVFDQIAGFIDNCTVTVFFFKDLSIGDRAPVSCEILAAFVITAFGYIIPAALVYCIEISRRSRFLLERVPESYFPSVMKLKMDGYKVATWFALGALQLTWLCMTLSRL